MLNSVPVQTYFNTHENGTISVAITPDSKFIASLSAEHPQVLAIWEWTTESEIPICTAEIDPKFGLQKNLRFNVENTFQLVTNSSNQALFYEWNMENGFVYYSPTLNDEVRDDDDDGLYSMNCYCSYSFYLNLILDVQ